jgi:hypothetical protein
MSQVLAAVVDSERTESKPFTFQHSSALEVGEAGFDYRPMPALAPVSGVFGVCGLIAFLGLFGILLAVVGVVVSLLAVWQIARAKGALSGRWVALAGLLLSIVSAVGGTSVQVYAYSHEVPEGFQRVSFSEEISGKGFVVEEGAQKVHPEIEALVGKSIFLKGFMYPTGEELGLTRFLLLKDSGECCFGGQPALQDMIGVKMAPGKTVDYEQGRVAIAGKFMLNAQYQGGSLEPVFLLEAEHFSRAQTSF